MKTIVLTGMSGVGKSTAASALAEKLGYEFTDIDKLVEQQEEMSIMNIFAQKGEPYFRQVEADIIKKISLSNTVVALGGGALETESTRKFLFENCIVIYLKANPKTLYDRLVDDYSRPLLKNYLNIDGLTKMINKREPNYQRAHYTVITDNKSIDEIVKELYDICKY